MENIKFHSTSKYKTNQLTTATHSLSCPKLRPNSANKRDYKTPQPIRVKELIGHTPKVKSTQKNSECTIFQPIRVTELIGHTTKVKSTQKNNDYKTPQPIRVKELIGHTPKVKSTQKNSECTIFQPIRVTELIGHTTKVKSTQKNNDCKILQPERIKQFIEKSETVKSTWKKTVVKQIVPERSSTFSSGQNTKACGKEHEAETHDHPKPFTRHVRRNLNFYKDSPSVSQFSSSDNNRKIEKCTNDTSVPKCALTKPKRKSLLPKPNFIKDKYLLKQNSNASKSLKVEPNKINENQEENTKSPTTSNTNEDLAPFPETPLGVRKSVMSVKCITEEEVTEKDNNKLMVSKQMLSDCNMNVRCNSPEMIYVSKTAILDLESKLRSVLTCVTKLLSTNDDEHLQTKKDKCCNAMQQVKDNIKTPNTDVPTVTTTNAEEDKISNIINNDENKENHEVVSEVLRKASDTDESFIELETQLNIEHAKRHSLNAQILQKTPQSIKCKHKRSLREYMALKSTMTFLKTPDIKKFRSVCNESSTHQPDLDKLYISNKILTDLRNLYADSPDL